MVDADDLFSLCVHDRDQRKRVGVEVGVGVLGAGVGCEDEGLEVSSVFLVVIWSAVWPRLDNYFGPFWEVQFLDLGLEGLGFSDGLCEVVKFTPGDC